MFGLKQEDIITIHSILEKHRNLEKVILYGSRAKGNYENGSDIDLTLIGGELTFTTLLKIESELDELHLPYKIDLSLFHKIENPDLKNHINRVGKVFYERD